jgi:CDP-6-deoxy-D-xylo-4-hexulose-3-dehydrase
MNLIQNKKIKVPYGLSVHNQKEINAVVKVLKTSTQMGKNVYQLEKKVAKLFHKKYGLMVNSGSSAIMLAIEVLKFPKDSEIITPSLTFGTTVSYIIRNGLIPVFVDVKHGSYCIDENQIKKLITNKTKAILAPNLLGNLVNWEKIKKIIKNKNIYIIEDSADTIGAMHKNKSTGYYSDISISSFYGSHIINCAGNGGIVCFNDKKLYLKAKLLRSWGRSSSLFDEKSEKIENRFNIRLDGIRYDKKFVFSEAGHNLEPSEIGAAFGQIQLRKLKQNIKTRIRNFNYITKNLKKFEKFFIFPQQLPNSYTAWLAYPLTIKDSLISRTEMQIYLEKKNIQTRVIFTGNILRQPGFKNIKAKIDKNGYPIADDIMRNGILFGCHQGMTNKMLNHLISSIESFLKFKKLI